MSRSAVVSGAGPAGMAAARLLHADGWSVTVVEIAPGVRADGYAIDLRGEGLDVADALGVLDDLRRGRTRMTGTSVLDEAGEVTAELPADEFGGDLEVPKSLLVDLLFRRIEADVDHLFGDSVTAVEQRGDDVRVTLASGRTLEADLLVGADGLWSRTRRLAVSADPAAVRHLGLSGAGFTTDNLLGLARHGVLRAGPGRAVYAFSAHDPTRLTVSLTFASTPPTLDRASRAEQQDAVSEAFAGDGWHVPELLERMRAADDFYFSSACQVHLPTWSAGRVVLVGDAACCAAPTSGMGTTQAFLAARALVEALRDDPVPVALQAYEQRMRPVADANQALGAEGAARFGADLHHR